MLDLNIFFWRKDVGFLIFGGKPGGSGVSGVENFSSTTSPGTHSFNSR